MTTKKYIAKIEIEFEAENRENAQKIFEYFNQWIRKGMSQNNVLYARLQEK